MSTLKSGSHMHAHTRACARTHTHIHTHTRTHTHAYVGVYKANIINKGENFKKLNSMELFKGQYVHCLRYTDMVTNAISVILF